MLSSKREFLQLNDLSIRYEDCGNKTSQPVIVLFHGNAFSLDDWEKTKTIQKLSEEGYHVCAIDLPIGAGSKSSKVDPTKYPRVSDLAPVIEEIFEKLGIKDAIIVGPSMGGAYALGYSITHEKNVRALVLIAPSLGRLDDEEKEKIQELKVPVLLIWGKNDSVVPLEYGRDLKEKIVSSKLLILNDAGHSAHLDKPGEFNEILNDYVADVCGK
ncbi:MAG: alpha/beta fold hydrolase [Nitrososphaerales archaeon]